MDNNIVWVMFHKQIPRIVLFQSALVALRFIQDHYADFRTIAFNNADTCGIGRDNIDYYEWHRGGEVIKLSCQLVDCSQ